MTSTVILFACPQLYLTGSSLGLALLSPRRKHVSVPAFPLPKDWRSLCDSWPQVNLKIKINLLCGNFTVGLYMYIHTKVYVTDCEVCKRNASLL